MKKFSLILVLILSLGLMAFGCAEEGVGTPTPAGAQTPTGAGTPTPGGGTTPLPGGGSTPAAGGNVTPGGPAGEDIVDILAADPRFGSLVTALEAAGAVDALRAEGPFTVFVPTDEAFARLPIGMLEELLGTPAPEAGTPTPEGAMATPEGGTPMPEGGTPAPEGATPGPEAAAALTNILLYHVVPGVYTSADLANTTCLDTVQGQPLIISVQDSAIFVNDVPVVEPDIQAANGVIHVIDGVLLPPTVDIIKTLTEDGRFTKLVGAIEAGTLTDTLLGEGPFTLFAPTDDAFAKLPAGTLEGLIGATPAPGNVTPGMATPSPGNVTPGMATPSPGNVTTPAPGNVTPPPGAGTPSPGNVTPAGNVTPPMGTPPAAPGAVPPSPGLTDLQNLLLYHVVPGEYLSCDFVANTTCLDTVQGRPLTVSIEDDTVLVNNKAEVVEPDILVPNGVIHVIDEVLLPPTKDIAQTLTEDGRFSTLLQALEAANLTGPLTGEGPPITLFAPTDEAFAQLPAGTVEALLGNVTALQNVLLYHVAPDEYLSCDLANTTAVRSVQGLPLIISSDGNTILVNDAAVVEPNVLVPNGVIHVVDKVLVPPDKDIAETLIEDGRFTTLIGALEAAELTAGLQGEGPFTVFAPSDDAFAALPPGTLEELGNNTAELQNILLYHVVPGIYTAGDLAGITSLDSIQGQALTITAEDGAVMVDEARVVEPNILVSNGIVHVIDGVLIPPG